MLVRNALARRRGVKTRLVDRLLRFLELPRARLALKIYCVRRLWNAVMCREFCSTSAALASDGRLHGVRSKWTTVPLMQQKACDSFRMVEVQPGCWFDPAHRDSHTGAQCCSAGMKCLCVRRLPVCSWQRAMSQRVPLRAGSRPRHPATPHSATWLKPDTGMSAALPVGRYGRV